MSIARLWRAAQPLWRAAAAQASSVALIRGRARAKDWLLYVLAALFVARFVYLSAG